jgi:RNA polymerase sigma factor (sigma-70 family)
LDFDVIRVKAVGSRRRRLAAAIELKTDSTMLLEQLFKEHHAMVLRAAYRYTGSMADAEDVAQAVFLRIAHAGTWAMDNPASYLYRAAVNGALDLLRKRVRENAVGLDEEIPQGTHASPERQREAGELRAWLRRALANLDPRAAEMFVLRYMEDCDLAEIARAMKTSRAVVAVTLHRARTRLRKDFRIKMRGGR